MRMRSSLGESTIDLIYHLLSDLVKSRASESESYIFKVIAPGARF